MPSLVTGDTRIEPVIFDEYKPGNTERVEHSLDAYDGGITKVIVQVEFAKVAGITPACARCIGVVFAAFGPLPIGTVAVRFIAETTTWSQHAYGNAVDFMCSGEKHRRIAFFLDANRAGLDIAHLLADPYFPSPLGNHFNHVHVDFFPQWGGTPPGHPI